VEAIFGADLVTEAVIASLVFLFKLQNYVNIDISRKPQQRPEWNAKTKNC